MLKREVRCAEKLKKACQAIKGILYEDEARNPAALMIQHQFKVFLTRNRLGELIEERKKRRNAAAG